MSIKAIAYDLEGTVVDVEFAHHQGFILAAKEFGYDLTMKEGFEKIHHFVGGPEEKTAQDIADLMSKSGISVDFLKLLAAKKEQYYKLIETTPITPREGFIEFYNFMKLRNIPQSIGSLTGMDEAHRLLTKSGLNKIFDKKYIVLREHVKNFKPAPDVWIETAKRMGVSANEQIVFEDSSRGIIGATQIGAYCVGMPVYNEKNVKDKLIDAGARRILLSWKDIDPQELLENANKR